MSHGAWKSSQSVCQLSALRCLLWPRAYAQRFAAAAKGAKPVRDAAERGGGKYSDKRAPSPSIIHPRSLSFRPRHALDSCCCCCCRLLAVHVAGADPGRGRRRRVGEVLDGAAVRPGHHLHLAQRHRRSYRQVRLALFSSPDRVVFERLDNHDLYDLNNPICKTHCTGKKREITKRETRNFQKSFYRAAVFSLLMIIIFSWTFSRTKTRFFLRFSAASRGTLRCSTSVTDPTRLSSTTTTPSR